MSPEEDAFLAGAQHQENQQLLCLVQIREALGDKDAKLSQDELVERVWELLSCEERCKFMDAMSLKIDSLFSKEGA